MTPTKTFKIAILAITTAAVMSFFAYAFPLYNKIFFVAIAVMTAILAWYKLESGLLVLLTELFIGSKGYLFSFEYGGLVVSIRMAIWSIIIFIWLVKVGQLVKTGRFNLGFIKNGFTPYYLVLFFFIIWGIIRGWLAGNIPGDLFFDANGWFYFALLFPIFYIIANGQKTFLNDIGQVLTAAIIWLGAETFFLLFVFSHGLNSIAYELYRWVRITGVGEITFVQGGFYRIFFQSHIYALIAFFIFLLLLSDYIGSKKYKLTDAGKDKKVISLLFLTITAMSLTLLTFSRSNWFGLLIGFVFMTVVCLVQKNFKKIANVFFLTFFTALASLLLIIFIVKFPYPSPIGGFDTASLFSDRALQIADEAGASSRWSLLPILWEKIKTSPWLGLGFGTTVTYRSSDPRILEINPSGLFTTYAFEWGLLDIWLKLGIFGLLSYLLLLFIIIYKSFKKISWLNFALATGLITLFFTNIFSPYLNHPLGIGYLLIASALINQEIKN